MEQNLKVVVAGTNAGELTKYNHKRPIAIC